MLNGGWKILLSLPNGLSTGGMTTWAIRTATALAHRGRQVIIAAHQPPAGLSEFALHDLHLPRDVSVRRLPLLTDDANWERNLREYAHMLPAVVIPTTIEASFEIAASLTMTAPSQVRVVGWNHSDHEYDYACLSHVAAICESFIVNTRQCLRELSERLPNRTFEMHLHPHVVEMPTSIRRQRDVNAPIRIGYAGRLEESAKRTSDLIEIAILLRDRGVPFRLRIVGDGPARNRLAERIERFRSVAMRQATSGPSSRRSDADVELLPPVPPTQSIAFWQECDCLVLPSAYEGLNYQMLEAMSVGCVPVVSGIDSGATELITHGVDGLIFNVADCEAAADCVETLSASTALCDNLAAAGLATIERHCRPEFTIAAIDAIFQDAVEASPRHWPRTVPISMRASCVVRSGETDDGIARMRSALRSLADSGRHTVAIYGAGRFLESIAAAFVDAPVAIHAFIDDDPANHGGRRFGWPVISRDEALALDIDAVVIASRMNEKQILRHAPDFAANGIELIPLCATPPSSTRAGAHTNDAYAGLRVDLTSKPIASGGFRA